MKTNTLLIKNCTLLIVGLLLYSCTANNNEAGEFADLAGIWKRDIDNKSEVAYEIWETEGKDLKGKGIVIKDKDTVFVEDLRIFEDNGEIYYGALVEENEKEILFKYSGMHEGYHVFENKDHDFPKTIKYKWNDRKLHANVGNDSRQLEFHFSKVSL